MPQVRKLTVEEVEKVKIVNPTATPKDNAVDVEPKKRGSPKGSKNNVNAQPKTDAGFEPEKLYTYVAADGCTMQSALKSKTMKLFCEHNKLMEFKK